MCCSTSKRTALLFGLGILVTCLFFKLCHWLLLLVCLSFHSVWCIFFIGGRFPLTVIIGFCRWFSKWLSLRCVSLDPFWMCSLLNRPPTPWLPSRWARAFETRPGGTFPSRRNIARWWSEIALELFSQSPIKIIGVFVNIATVPLNEVAICKVLFFVSSLCFFLEFSTWRCQTRMRGCW